MADIDENDEIEQKVSGGDSEESPRDENASAEGSGSEPTPEEQEMMAMAGEPSDDEASDGETPDSPDETPDAPDDEAAVEDIQPPDDSGSNDLLDQSDIEKVLKDAGGDNAASSFDLPVDEIGGHTDPEVKQADFQQLSSGSEKGDLKNIELLMDVELPISIELGKTKMNIADILGLAPGSIVELDKLVGEPVDLLVNQRCVAKGEVVVVEENFGLRITQLVSPEERLRNLQ
jgi:flagellar motor switch protein FliN/FliY